MAIFNNSSNDNQSVAAKNSTTTIITEGSFIKGEMTLSCDLYVDGTFDGIIDSQKSITVGKNGHIQGTIKTKHLIVQGLVSGNIDSDRIEIKSSGRVEGSIISSELIIEAKGIFEGESKIKSKEKSEVSSIFTDDKVK
jgi:cytoskeletal protein CcmA (bactofilin family)